MSNSFGLPYLEALSRSLDIVKRDAVHFKDQEQYFSVKLQMNNLINFQQKFDLESAMKIFRTIEPNEEKLLKQVKNFMRIYMVQKHHPEIQLNFNDFTFLECFINKYTLKSFCHHNRLFSDPNPIFYSFPMEEYNLLISNSNLSESLPVEMKIYKNFKFEYALLGLFSLLPSGKKYGGYVKASVHFFVNRGVRNNLIPGIKLFHFVLAACRCNFNSKLHSPETRLESFKKLNIKEKDCSLWSQEFDKIFPGYKDVHKFFDQVS